MKLKIEASASKIIIAVIAILGSIIYAIGTGLSVKFVVALPVMLFMGFFVRIELVWKWLDSFALVVSSFIALTLLQLETGSIINDLGLKKMILNWFLAISIFLSILIISRSISFTCKAGSVFLFVIGFIDALVISFRGNQISISDIYSIRTALSVVGNYKLSLNPMFILAIIIFIGYFMCLYKVKFATKKIGTIRMIGLPTIAVMLVVTLCNIADYQVATWGNQGCTANGVFLEWVLEIRDLQIEEPVGYSVESVAEIVDKYSKDNKANGRKPNIIVIMSEAYSDLSILGELETSEEVMPNFDKLCEESVHGYALSSVYGGNTAVSEWEFLTGSTMAFMPAGSVAYQQYVKEGDNSLVSMLENQGYHTIAMHPYLANGWNRNKVFENFGFDKSIFLDDFKQEKLVRSYVSDEEFYETIIAQFEEKEKNEPLFVFGISMQNHGGYVNENFDSRVKATNLSKEYSDVNQYLSLLQITDVALETLINYFENYDEDVVIVFFGDHQPRLNDEFNKEMESDFEFSKYKIPFFIWNNYQNTERYINLTSINYLPALMLQEAQITLPPYYQFLLNIQEDIPVIHAYGYCTEDGYHNFTEVNETDKAILDSYWMLQYANVFDKKASQKLFN